MNPIAPMNAPSLPVVTDEMVSRFLGWRLPDDFSPDCGITFKRIYNENSPFGPQHHKPVGTNLLSADQARAMLEHVLGGAGQSPIAGPTAEKIAPVQGWPAGIPWSLHLEAYAAYCKKWSPQKALIEGGCRGGFGTGELDEFIPGWRDRVSEITALKAEIVRLRAALAVSPERTPDSGHTVAAPVGLPDAASEALRGLDTAERSGKPPQSSDAA